MGLQMTTSKDFQKFLNTQIDFDMDMRIIHDFMAGDYDYEKLSYDDKMGMITNISESVKEVIPDVVRDMLVDIVAEELEIYLSKFDNEDEDEV